jgi:hypothetical protein
LIRCQLSAELPPLLFSPALILRFRHYATRHAIFIIIFFADAELPFFTRHIIIIDMPI